jgi:sterol 3beta-glucosyltransferase
MLTIDSAPHDWLFPKMAAVVHHGGAGTTAAALRAGIPSVVIPFFADQFYWGSRVTKLGVGPPTLPFSQFNEVQLADRIRSAVNDPHILEQSRQLANGIAAESGVDRMVHTFQKAVKSGAANGQFRKRTL